ncbi:ribonuclease Y [Nitrospinae bacterium AH_259_B05_G02_I21]|nr:ribonuclease Y [Nitrospinae bacterium AH_259_B05_G02_I21]MDA2932613.1 ribonuclease Y [Nitrospinae bacterium AH-259-F20]
MVYPAIVGFAVLVVGFALGMLIQKVRAARRVKDADAYAERVRTEAEREAKTIRKEALLEAKEAIYQAQKDFEHETKERRSEVLEIERRLAKKEENLDKKVELLEKRDQDLRGQEASLQEARDVLAARQAEAQRLVERQVAVLEEVSGLSREEAKAQIIDRLTDEARREAVDRLRKIEEETEATAEKKAQQVVSLAMERCATERVAASTVSVVGLPNDEMKGRIIGREGRNIRALEAATGVDLIIDDTPEAVILSAFDPVKREIARIALERLIKDGRIHPGRIEEIVAKVKKEMEQLIREEGEAAAFELSIEELHPEMIKLVGRLKFRTSYGQNALQHVKEVAHLCGMMASELGIDATMARRAGLLHDIGKSIDHQTEGSHVEIGLDLARRYGEPAPVLDAIASHHEDQEPTHIEAVLVSAADTLSAGRPGARRATLETHIKRLAQLEEVGNSFRGVEHTYAIQAGREVRVIVQPESIDDNEAFLLAKDIAKKIEAEVAYPGEIKVTVIRETRATDFAR